MKGKKLIGGLFDDFLKEDGIYKEVQVTAIKRVLDHILDVVPGEKGDELSNQWTLVSPNEQLLLALAKKLKKAVSDTRQSFREAMGEVDKTLASQKKRP